MPDTFAAFVYDTTTGEMIWRDYTRETLLDEVTRGALFDLYRTIYTPIGDAGVYGRADRLQDILHRISRVGPLPFEIIAVERAWARWWHDRGGSIRTAARLDSSSIPHFRV